MIRVTLTGAVFCAVLLVGLPQAFADKCTDKLACNDPASPRCAFNPSRSEWKCIPRNAVFCAAPTRSYYCQAGQNCNGDGSTQPACR
jgi:hypothetical protein